MTIVCVGSFSFRSPITECGLTEVSITGKLPAMSITDQLIVLTKRKINRPSYNL